MKIEEAAKRGAKALDKTNPLWYQDVDINRLDLADGEYCILGQLNGSYYDAGGYIKDLDPYDESPKALAFKLGFNSRRDSAFPSLTMAWIKEIFKRRQA